MADERTIDQVEADKMLDASMDAQAKAYSDDGNPGVVTASIGVYAATKYVEGDSVTVVGICTPDDNTMPYHVAIGLLESALIIYRARVTEPDEE